MAGSNRVYTVERRHYVGGGKEAWTRIRACGSHVEALKTARKLAAEGARESYRVVEYDMLRVLATIHNHGVRV